MLLFFQSGTQWILFWFNVIGFLLAIVFSGIFPLNTCIKRLSGDSGSADACSPNPVANLILSIFILLLSVVVMATQLAFNIKRRSKVVQRVRRRNAADDNSRRSGALGRVIQTKDMIVKYVMTPADTSRRGR